MPTSTASVGHQHIVRAIGNTHQYDDRFVVGCVQSNKVWTRGCLSNESGVQVQSVRCVRGGGSIQCVVVGYNRVREKD